MTSTTLRAAAPLRVDGLTLVPLEHTVVTVTGVGQRIFAGADKRPAGVVIIDGRGARAIGVDGLPLELDALAGRVAGLRERL